MQYLNGDDGYCGECTIQVLMLKYGVWLPQQYVRLAATGSPKGAVLVETGSYPTAMRNMKINAVQFQGSGYQAYMAWIKSWLVRGVGVAMVWNFKDSDNTDGTYDHITPVTGIITRTPSAGYDPNDTLIVHTHFTRNLVQKRVGNYTCPAGGRGSWPGSALLDNGGCVPRSSLRGWAWAFLGPTYLGIGPRVELLVPKPSEPGVGRSETLQATVIVRGLTPGRTCRVYQFTDPKQVPPAPSSRIPAAVAPWKTFVATSAEARLGVSFPSNVPRYFIAVQA